MTVGDPFIIIPLLFLLLSFTGLAYYLLRPKTSPERLHYLESLEGRISDSLLVQLESKKGLPDLHGEEKILTVMFCDIRSFTKISENMQTRDLLNLLNRLFGKLSDVIIQNNGTIDKYMGDSIMAFWGAPIFFENHAYLSCLTALQMRNAAEEFNSEYNIPNGEKVRIGVGINTGPMIAGQVCENGSKEYTVIGDSVNVGARLESLNKVYGTSIIFTQQTLEKMKQEVRENPNVCGKSLFFREIDKVRLVGRSRATRVYELVGFVDYIDDSEVKAFKLFRKGLRVYRDRQWRRAEELFRKVSRRFDGGDPVSKVYIGRCKEYQKRAPLKSWNGVYRPTSK